MLLVLAVYKNVLNTRQEITGLTVRHFAAKQNPFTKVDLLKRVAADPTITDNAG